MIMFAKALITFNIHKQRLHIIIYTLKDERFCNESDNFSYFILTKKKKLMMKAGNAYTSTMSFDNDLALITIMSIVLVNNNLSKRYMHVEKYTPQSRRYIAIFSHLSLFNLLFNSSEFSLYMTVLMYSISKMKKSNTVHIIVEPMG